MKRSTDLQLIGVFATMRSDLINMHMLGPHYKICSCCVQALTMRLLDLDQLRRPENGLKNNGGALVAELSAGAPRRTF